MADNKFSSENNILDTIKQLIAEKNYDKINLLMQNQTNNESFKEKTEELIDLCRTHLTDTNFKNEPDLYYTCEDLLKLIAKNQVYTEVLFDLLQILRLTKSDNVFTSVLKALQECLLQKDINRGGYASGLNEIYSYISKLKYPKYLTTGYDEKQRRLLEQDEQIHRILLNYITVTIFYEPLLTSELLPHYRIVLFRDTRTCKINALASFLMQLLTRPLALLDLSLNEKRKTNTHSLQCAKQIIKDLCRIFKNPYYFLQYVEPRCRWKCKQSDSQQAKQKRYLNVFMDPQKFPLLSFSMFYYLLIAEEITPIFQPLVYNPVYIFETSMYLIKHLFEQNEPIFHLNGISLCYKILNNLNEAKIPATILELEIIEDFFEELTKVVIYSEQEEVRKKGVKLFEKVILQFDEESQSLILPKLIKITKHSGLVGFLIMLFKNLISQKMDKNEIHLLGSGENFKNIIKLCCKLENGIETDLIQNSDRIISALNMLRYFARKDCANQTGFWNFINEIKKEFIEPLRESVNLSKAHYKNDQYCLENDINMDEEEKLLEKLMINDESVPKLDKNQKINILSSYILVFELIESLLARINELIDIKCV